MFTWAWCYAITSPLSISFYSCRWEMSVDFVDLACQKQSFRNIRSHNFPENAASQGIKVWLPVADCFEEGLRWFESTVVQGLLLSCSHISLPVWQMWDKNFSKEDMLGHLKLNHLRGSLEYRLWCEQLCADGCLLPRHLLWCSSRPPLMMVEVEAEVPPSLAIRGTAYWWTDTQETLYFL